MTREVYETAAFTEWASENVILLELDVPDPRNPSKKIKELMERYGVRGFPTVLFLDAEGKELGRSGYRPGGPKGWLEDANKILNK